MLGVQNPKVVPFPSAVGITPLQFSAPFNQPMPRNIPMRGMSSSMIGFVDSDSAQPDIVIRSRDFYRQQIMDKARIARFNDQNLRMGGTANKLPKPIPTGSFVRMLNTSGNQNNFGDGAGAGVFSGGGGSMRSKAGSELGIDLVKKRGKQLQVLAEEQARLQALPGEDFPSTAETTFRTEMAQGVPLEQTPLSKDQATGFSVEIIFNTLQEASSVGEFSGITTDDLRRAYQILSSKVGLTFSQADLQDYYSATQEAVRTARAVLSDTERVAIRTRRQMRLAEMAKGKERTLAGLSGRTELVEERFGMTFAKYTALWRLDLLVRVLIDTFNLQPRQRGLFVRGEAKRILKMKPTLPGVGSLAEFEGGLAEEISEQRGRTTLEEPTIDDEDFDYGNYLDSRTTEREREALRREENIRDEIQQADDQVETSAFGEPMTDIQEEDAPPADDDDREYPGLPKMPPGKKPERRMTLEEMTRQFAELGEPQAPTQEQLAPDIDQPQREFALARASARATPTTTRRRRTAVPDETQTRLSGFFKKPETGRGKGRPQKYFTPEDKIQARREANQLLRKKKNAYDKAYKKAIMEGIPAGKELDRRAMEIFAEFGFAPSQAFPFGSMDASEDLRGGFLLPIGAIGKIGKAITGR